MFIGENMETILEIALFLLALLILVLLGFFITWVVGKIIKKNGPKKTGKLGMIITSPFIIIAIIITFTSSYSIANKQAELVREEKKENKKFITASESFQTKYLSAGSNLEKAGTNEYNSWGDAIDSNESDDFDVDSVVTDAVTDNYDKILSADSDIQTLKKDLRTMKYNDTGKYDYNVYNKAYKNMKSFYTFVSSPSGSYMDFSDTMTKLDNKVTSSYDDLTE